MRQYIPKLLVLVILSMVINVIGAEEPKPVAPPAPMPTPAPAPVAPAPAPAPQPAAVVRYPLLPAFKTADIITVEEEQKWEGNYTIKTTDPSVITKSQTYPYWKQYRHQYKDLILLVSDDKRSFHNKREYIISERKANVPGQEVKTEKISLEGKTIRIESKDFEVTATEKLAPQDSIIIEVDNNYIKPVNWFYPLLPAEPLTIGATYEINNKELARILFADQYDDKLCEVSGTGTLEEIVNAEKLNCARVLLNLKATRNDPANNTAYTVELDGTYLVSLPGQGAERLVDLSLTGSFSFEQSRSVKTSKKKGEPEQKVEVSTTGGITIKLKVK